MSRTRIQSGFEWTLMVMLILGAGALTQAQDQPINDDGPIIRVGPDRSGDAARPPRGGRVFAPGFPEEPPRGLPTYWVGLVGGPVDPAVRHHVDLPEGIGLQVMEVVPNSPAAEAGLQQYDIMVRAGDIDLDEMQDLVELVRTEGERHGQISLEILRGGQTETVWLTPVERPADAGFPRPAGPQPFARGDQPGGFRDFFQGFVPQGRGPGVEFRDFGPGVFLGQQQQKFGFTQLPDGTSVKFEKRNDQPTKITVERGGEVWEIEGDDPQALDQLPDDIRPYVERVLGQAQNPMGGFDMEGFRRNFQGFMPQMGQPGGDLNERLQRMEQQLQELMRGQNNPPADDQVR